MIVIVSKFDGKDNDYRTARILIDGKWWVRADQPDFKAGENSFFELAHKQSGDLLKQAHNLMTSHMKVVHGYK